MIYLQIETCKLQIDSAQTRFNINVILMHISSSLKLKRDVHWKKKKIYNYKKRKKKKEKPIKFAIKPNKRIESSLHGRSLIRVAGVAHVQRY